MAKYLRGGIQESHYNPEAQEDAVNRMKCDECNRQRWHRHFKSGQATGNERLFVHVYRVVGVDEGGGGRSTTDNVRQ